MSRKPLILLLLIVFSTTLLSAQAIKTPFVEKLAKLQEQELKQSSTDLWKQKVGPYLLQTSVEQARLKATLNGTGWTEPPLIRRSLTIQKPAIGVNGAVF